MATQTKILENPSPAVRNGFWVDQIQGRYRRITVHQLAIAWWLYSTKHITMRQLRVWFAAHEMAEKRNYTKREAGDDRPRKPHYTLDEIKRLVGGRGSKTADRALSRDVQALGELGLVIISTDQIEFAVSIDQIKIDDVSGFWSFFEQIPNNRRTVPVPRRTCRALAGGFQPSVMAMMIALLIRSLYWHKKEGEYRVDGRTKLSWIAEVFKFDRKSMSNARTRLIALGWITPIDAPQWELNKWGQRYVLNVDSFCRENQEASVRDIPCPNSDFVGEIASPDLNSSSLSSSKKDLITRKPAPSRADPAGVSIETQSASRKGDACKPTLHNITHQDIRDTGRLFELHRQAVERGLSSSSDAARFNFLALAERARAQADNPPAMFSWLLRHRRFDFITLADEDAASHRLREFRDGPRRSGGCDDLSHSPKARQDDLSDDEQFVQACIQVAKKQRGLEPSRIARQVRGWDSERWEAAHMSYTQKQFDRYAVSGDE